VKDGVRVHEKRLDRAVEEVSGDVHVPREPLQGGKVGCGRGVGGRVAAVDADDDGAGLDEGMREVGADKAGGAGHHGPAGDGGGQVGCVL
jgi:hypothetical protein